MHRNRILSGILATLAIVAKAQDIVAPDVTELTNATLKDFALFNDLILVNCKVLRHYREPQDTPMRQTLNLSAF